MPHLETPELWSSTEIPWRLPFHPRLSDQVGARGNPAVTTTTVGPVSFETEEYRTSWFLGKINAAQAYAAGFTGKGVLVAVVDTGLDITHPEFIGRVSNLARSFIPNAPPGQMSDSDEVDGHGTHVSGIVGAARDGVVMHGVAYNATILPLRAIFEDDPDDDDDDDLTEALDAAPTFRALRFAAGSGAKVLNGSYGPDALPPKYIQDPDSIAQKPIKRILNPHYRVMANTFVLGGSFLDGNYQALKAAAKADIVLVFSAGNEYEEQPTASAQPGGIGLYPYIRPGNHANGVYRFLELDKDTDLANPNTYKTLDPGDRRLAKIDLSDLQGALIVVVATDHNNEIASYSNRCGVTFLWCLAAPGGDIARGQPKNDVEILSTVPDGKYVTEYGTSMASPVVAGGAAVLREAFPYMTARQIIEIILTTTDDIGAREIYGRGLFNLGRAARGPREFGAEGFAQSFEVDTNGFNSVWSNDIVGTGRLVKRGGGSLILTGANTYAGGTAVVGGELTLHGSVRSHVAVGEAATLRGTGRVDAPLTLAGRLEPGAGNGQFGTFTVTEDAALLRSSKLRMDANMQGDHDRLAIGGVATLSGGTLEIRLADGLAPTDSPLAVVTTAGRRTGTFGRFHTNSISAFLDPRLRYVGNNVVVTFERNSMPFASVETNPETRDVAEAVQKLERKSRLDEAIARIDAVSADKAFDLLSGDLHASAVVATYGNATFLQDTILGRLSKSGDASDHRAEDSKTVNHDSLDQRRWVLWGEGIGSWGRVRSSDYRGALDTSTGGFIFGAEASVAPVSWVGLAAGFTSTTFDVDRQLSTGRNESVFGALYGSTGWGALALRVGASYAGHDISTTRNIAFTGFSDRASASYGGATLQAFSELGYRIELANVRLEPVVGGSVLRLSTDSFVENGGPAALVGYARTHDLGTTTLGLRVEARPSDETRLALRGLLGWRHAYGDIDPEALLAFGGGAQAFETSGTPVDRDALLAQASLDWQATSTVNVGVSYTGQLGRSAQDHSLKGTLNWRF